MSARTSRSIAKILDQVGISDATALTVRARALMAFERQVLVCLPQDLAANCHVAGVRDGCLRLIADSAAWAARLRFQEPLLLKALNQRGTHEVRRIHVRVSPREQAHSLPKRKLKLSAENVQLLVQTARALEDPRLAQALLRLARHGVVDAYD